MAKVRIEIPSLLWPMTNGDTELEVEATSVRGAMEGLIQRYPSLRVHLFEESGDLRQHVLCLHNQKNVRWEKDLSTPVLQGDHIRIHQAVSGG